MSRRQPSPRHCPCQHLNPRDNSPLVAPTRSGLYNRSRRTARSPPRRTPNFAVGEPSAPRSALPPRAGEIRALASELERPASSVSGNARSSIERAPRMRRYYRARKSIRLAVRQPAVQPRTLRRLPYQKLLNFACLQGRPIYLICRVVLAQIERDLPPRTQQVQRTERPLYLHS